MNSSMNAQRSNRTFFFVAIGLSAVLLAAAGFFLTSFLNGGAAKGLKAAEKSCVSALRSSGFNPTSLEGRVTAHNPAAENVEALVYQSGVLIASCPAHKLTDYCAGAGCQRPGVSFTLRLKQ